MLQLLLSDVGIDQQGHSQVFGIYPVNFPKFDVFVYLETEGLRNEK